MTKIKLCGLSRIEDIKAANELKPEFIGFVFAEKSKRRVTKAQASELRRLLDTEIKAVGVFVDEGIEEILSLLSSGVIDIAQLHGSEDEEYIKELKARTKQPVIKAFTIKTREDVEKAEKSSADYVLLDAGKGCGETFDWSLLDKTSRPFFLAGGLNPENISSALRKIKPFAVDVSSGIEINGRKDYNRMVQFVSAVRKEEE